MHIFKKIVVGISAALLVPMLFSFGMLWSIHQTIGTPAPVKEALRESGLYEHGISEALAQAQKDQPTTPAEGDLPLNQPEIRTIITQSFTPAYLQSQVEPTIDNIYKWLDGTNPKLAFQINLADGKANFANGVSAYIQQRLATAPTCPASSVPPSQADVDPFAATCLPAGVSAASLAEKTRTELLQGEALKNTTITPADLKDEQGKPLDERLQAIPQAYQQVQTVILLAALFAVLMAVAIVFLSSSRRNGLRRVAIIAMSVGAVNALLAWLSSWGVHRAAVEIAKSPADASALQQRFVHLAGILVGELRTWWMGYGLVLVAIGVIILLVLHFTRPSPLEQAERLAAAPDPIPAEKGKHPTYKGIKPSLPELKSGADIKKDKP
jgi:hypothetical protein